MPSDRPGMSPAAKGLKGESTPKAPRDGSLMSRFRSTRAGDTEGSESAAPQKASTPVPSKKDAPRPVVGSPKASGPGRTRTAHLRLTRIDPLSVMKMAFLLSIALGIVLVVAITIIWSVLSAVGVWDNINSAVQQVIGTEQGETFDVSKYVGTPRVIGFSLIASVINVVLITAIATLAAFVYNLAAALLGGVEMTWAEDR